MFSWRTLKKLIQSYIPKHERRGQANSSALNNVFDLGHDNNDQSERSKGTRRYILWKARKSLKIVIPSPTNTAVVPFESNVFEEHAKENSAAIQFCIGNHRKIPSIMCSEFNNALFAEGFCVYNTTRILESVFQCAAQGKDLQGNQLLHGKLIPLINKDGYDMKRVCMYIDRDWKGICILMVLKETHRLYGNYKNAIMGLVTHSTCMEAAFLLGNAMNCLETEHPRVIRSTLYRYSTISNSYEEMTEPYDNKKKKEGIIKVILNKRGFILMPILSGAI